MYNHAPKDYKCPFCALLRGETGDYIISEKQDIFYRDEPVTALVSCIWWPKNKGNVLIIPNEHFENLYDIKKEYLNRIHELSQKVAVAIKESYKCDGITVRQHNEHDGGQEVWHYHLHIFPRYKDDGLYKSDPVEGWIPPADRLPYAEKLKKYFEGKK